MTSGQTNRQIATHGWLRDIQLFTIILLTIQKDERARRISTIRERGPYRNRSSPYTPERLRIHTVTENAHDCFCLARAKASAMAMVPPGGGCRSDARCGADGRFACASRADPVLASPEDGRDEEALPGASSSRIVSPIRCRFRSTSITFTLTI